MSILITGSSGFIGTNFCNYLTNKKKSFIGIDIITNPYIKLDKFYKIDLKDCSKLEKIFIKHEVKEVVHLAALAGLNTCHKNPKKALNSNLISTFNVLELSKKYKVKKIILTSSFSTNNFYQNPSIYGFTKLATEQMGITYNKNFNQPLSIIKLSNIYGPYSFHKESAIHKFIKQNIKNKKLIIHDSGKQVRDFLFVLDVVKFIYKIINLKKNKLFYNLCSGKNLSILDAKKLIDEVTNIRNLCKHIKAPIGYNTSIIKNKNYTDLNLSITSFKSGLMQTYKWYNSKNNKFFL